MVNSDAMIVINYITLLIVKYVKTAVHMMNMHTVDVVVIVDVNHVSMSAGIDGLVIIVIITKDTRNNLNIINNMLLIIKISLKKQIKKTNER